MSPNETQSQRSKTLTQNRSVKVRTLVFACFFVVSYAGTATAQGASSSFALKPSASPRHLSLQEALDLALTNHKEIRLGREGREQDQERVAQAYANYLPRLVLDGTLTFNFPEIKASLSNKSQALQQAQVMNSLADLLTLTSAQRDPLAMETALAQAALYQQSAADLSNSRSTAVVIQPATLFEAKLTLTQPLFNFESIQSIRTAELAQKRNQRTLGQTESAAMVEVARSYLNTLRNKHLIDSAHNRIRRAKQQLTRMREKYALGLARSVDVKRLQVELTGAQTQLTQSETQYRLALGALGVLIGVDETFEVEDSTGHLAQGASDPAEAQTEYALAQREDLRAQELALKSANQSEQSTYAGFLPSLNLVGQGAYTTNTSGFINKPFRGAIMLQASVPLFDGGFRYASLRDNRSKIRQEKIKLADLEHRINAEIRGRLVDIETKSSALKAARETLNLQRAIYEDAQSNVSSGLLEILDLIDANQKLADAEVAVENASLDLELTYLELKAARGDFKSSH